MTIGSALPASRRWHQAKDRYQVNRSITMLAVLAVAALVATACGSSKPVISTGSTVAPTTGSSVPSTRPTVAPNDRYPNGAPVRCGVSTGGDLPPSSASAQDRPVTASDMAGFVTAFAALNGIPPSIAVITPGSDRVAYVPSAHQYWGLATFEPAPGVTLDPHSSLSNAFTSERHMLAFVQPQDCPWTYNGPLSVPFPCPGAKDIPVGVLQAWHLKSASPAACAHPIDVPAPR